MILHSRNNNLVPDEVFNKKEVKYKASKNFPMGMLLQRQKSPSIKI